MAVDKKTYPSWAKSYKKYWQYKDKLMKRFGMTPEDHMTLLVRAEFKCEICKAEVKGHNQHVGRRERACIDHDHKTNKVRGILCAACNWGIGMFKDDPTLLQNALDYLNRERK